MKKVLFILIMVASSFAALAQKGNWYIGGVAGFSSNASKDASGFKTTSSSWALGPEGGTFLKDDIQLGLALGLGGSSTKNDNKTLTTTTNIGPTAYVRKFFKVTDNFSVFAGFYLNYLHGKTTDYTFTPSTESTESSIGARVGVGIAYALSPRFTAFGQYGVLGYQHTSFKQGGNDNGSESSFNFGVNTIGSSTLSQANGSGSVFNVGIYYTFKKMQ